MDRIIIRIAASVYCITVAISVWLIYNPQNALPIEVLEYMKWWYSQPQTEFQFYLTKIGIAAFLLSVVSAIFLFFLKKWAGYLYISATIFLLTTEWLLPDYSPQTSLLTSVENLTLISMGCIFTIFCISSKLDTFKT